MKLLPGESVEDWFDRTSRENAARMRETILASAHPDAEKILADYTANIRNLERGLTGARSCWHSISPKQARTLAILGAGGALHKDGDSIYFDYRGLPHDLTHACDIRTVRALCAHELAVVDGGTFDPESKIVITERGQFVLRHGYTKDGKWF